MKHEASFISALSDIAPQYDAFLLDLWGVVHDGKSLYPGAKTCLEQLRAAGKKITFLSNAPRRASVVVQTLAGMGIGAELYDEIITSGEVAYRCLARPEQSPFTPRGAHYLYIGLERDRKTLDGLHYTEMQHPEQAQFVLLSHSYEDNQPMATLRPVLARCAELALPVVCINPDMEVVRLTGERVYCAGEVAQEYRQMGGEVIYFGKPHSTVYEHALASFAGVEPARIVAVGDTLATDILGGARMKLATVLVTGGVLRMDGQAADYQEKCQSLFAANGIVPDYVIPAFRYK